MDQKNGYNSSIRPIIENAKQLVELCNLFRSQKKFYTNLQPNKRSFSNPELQREFLSDFQSFRQFIMSHNLTIMKSQNETNFEDHDRQDKCDDNKNDCCDIPDRPTPTPRSRKNKIVRKSSAASSSLDSSKDDTYSINRNSESYSPLIDRNSNFMINDHPSSKSISSDEIEIKIETNSIGRSAIKFPIEIPSIKTPIKIKTNKNSFRSFLKMNKIKNNKFLSLRSKNSTNRKFLFDLQNQQERPCKAQKPTRNPPPPPILVFRPAAPLPPAEKSSEADSTLTEINHQDTSDTISELYHDAANFYDVEGIYCSVEDENNKENHNMDNQEDRSEKRTINHQDHLLSTENYYDDGLCIYEELSSNEGTIYEEYGDDDEIIYDNAECFVEINSTNNVGKYTKQQKKLEKTMKRFNMSGKEIPVNAGIVKENCKGSKNDLYVRQGETVLILRMENNPPGKWLAKNERSKIGYIDLNNVYLETDSIKAAFKTLNSF